MEKGIPCRLIALIAILLLFTLALVLIWFWYDLRIKRLDKELISQSVSIHKIAYTKRSIS